MFLRAWSVRVTPVPVVEDALLVLCLPAVAASWLLDDVVASACLELAVLLLPLPVLESLDDVDESAMNARMSKRVATHTGDNGAWAHAANDK